MSTYSKLYWLTRLDNLDGLLIALIVVSAISILVIALFRFMTADFDEFYDEEVVKERKELRSKFTSKIKYIVAVLVVSVLLKVFLPTKNEVIFIVAGGKTLDYIKSDTSLSKIPYQATKYVSDYLDKKITEIQKH